MSHRAAAPDVARPRPARPLLALLVVAVAALGSGAVLAQAGGTSRDVPIPEKKPPPVGKEGTPTVTIRSEANGDVVEEYRTGGKVYMVHVRPKRGVPYYLYDDNHNGRLDRSDAEKGDISPVYYTLYEWD